MRLTHQGIELYFQHIEQLLEHGWLMTPDDVGFVKAFAHRLAHGQDRVDPEELTRIETIRDRIDRFAPRADGFRPRVRARGPRRARSSRA